MKHNVITSIIWGVISVLLLIGIILTTLLCIIHEEFSFFIIVMLIFAWVTWFVYNVVLYYFLKNEVFIFLNDV